MDSLSLVCHGLYRLVRLELDVQWERWALDLSGGTGRFELGWKLSAKNSHSSEDLTWCQSSVLQRGHWGKLWKRFLVALLPVNIPQAGARGEQPAHSLRADSQWMVEKGGAGKLGLVWKLLFGRGTDENCLGVAEQCCTRSAQSSVEPHLLRISRLLLLHSWIDAAFSSLRQKTSIHLSAGSLDNLVSLPIWPWAFLLSISKEMRNGSVWFSGLKWKDRSDLLKIFDFFGKKHNRYFDMTEHKSDNNSCSW